MQQKIEDLDFKNGLFNNPKKLSEAARNAYEKLSPIQREFCHAMQTAESNRAAAIAAGYSPNTASSKACQLLTKPEVQEYLGILGLLRAQAIALDSRGLISLQLDLYYKCMENGDHKNANTALDQLAKMMGMYQQRKVLEGKTIPSPKEQTQMSDKENIELNEMLGMLMDVNTDELEGTND